MKMQSNISAVSQPDLQLIFVESGPMKYLTPYKKTRTVLTSPHNWKYTITIEIWEHDIIRITYTKNKNPNR